MRTRPRSAKLQDAVKNPGAPTKLLTGDNPFVRGGESQPLEGLCSPSGLLNTLRGTQQRHPPDGTGIEDVGDLNDTPGGEGGHDSPSGAILRKGSIRSVSSLHHVWGSTTMAGDLQVEERVH